MLNTPGRSNWRSINYLSNISFNKNILIELLTKRELLYYKFFNNNKYNIILPKYLNNSPNNPLLLEIERNFTLTDPISYSTEVTRDIYYQNLNFIKFLIIKEFLFLSNNLINTSFLNLKVLNNYLYFYLFDNYLSFNINKNNILYKDQYRPMRKGITNMVRLHSTGAVALPIEIRLHILASSKDVIHS